MITIKTLIAKFVHWSSFVERLCSLIQQILTCHAVCIVCVHVENCGVQKRGGVTSEQRIEKSCEVSHAARTAFGESECVFVRMQCNKSVDGLQPLPQSTK